MDKDKKQEIKTKYLNDLFEDLKYSISKFDSQTLAISGGALGLSLTFIDEIVPLNVAVHIWLFYVALALFIYCITIGFVGHYLSMRYTDKTINRAIDDNFEPLKNDGGIRALNLSIVFTLPIGIILLVLFCIINIETSKNYEAKTKPETNHAQVSHEEAKCVITSDTLDIKNIKK